MMGLYAESDIETVCVEFEGKDYDVDIEVTRTQIRRGTYSSTAEDPDEYYGVWAVYGTAVAGAVYDEDGEVTVLAADELPPEVVEKAEAIFDNE
jgi:hypothetical protein